MSGVKLSGLKLSRCNNGYLLRVQLHVQTGSDPLDVVNDLVAAGIVDSVRPRCALENYAALLHADTAGQH
jgi:hypothetical protein